MRRFEREVTDPVLINEMLKLMGEEISVTSVKGEGSCFSFTVHREPIGSKE
jgi:signal transduction histidine kinase